MASPPKTFQYHQNLYILEDPIAYRREVQKYLDLVRTTYVGRTLLKYIYMRGRRLLIMPYVPAKETTGPVNAYAITDDPDDTNTYALNAPVMRPFDVPGYGTIMLPNGFIGTGKGSTVTLKYHPATYRQLIANKHRMDPGDGPGEVLFHEMVHAFRMMDGKMLSTTVSEDPGMDDFEEFCAILAANMYRSERGFKHLRLNHAGHVVLGKDLSDSGAYYVKFSDEIDKWFASQKAFCQELAASKAVFNPMKYADDFHPEDVPTPMAL